MNLSITKKAIMVGRHTPNLGDEADKFDIVANENITWSLVRAEAIEQLEKLIGKAQEIGAIVLLQNVPGILAAALLSEQAKAGGQLPIQIGLIISVPGSRLADVVTEYSFPVDPDAALGFEFARSAAMTTETAVKAANFRAKVERIESETMITVRVTVDPVSEFKFDHIDWL